MRIPTKFLLSRDKYFVLTHCLHNDKYYGRLAKKISSTHTTGKMKEIKKMNNITF